MSCGNLKSWWRIIDKNTALLHCVVYNGLEVNNAGREDWPVQEQDGSVARAIGGLQRPSSEEMLDIFCSTFQQTSPQSFVQAFAQWESINANIFLFCSVQHIGVSCLRMHNIYFLVRETVKWLVIFGRKCPQKRVLAVLRFEVEKFMKKFASQDVLDKVKSFWSSICTKPRRFPRASVGLFCLMLYFHKSWQNQIPLVCDCSFFPSPASCALSKFPRSSWRGSPAPQNLVWDFQGKGGCWLANCKDRKTEGLVRC